MHQVIHVVRRNNPYVTDGWHPIAVDACIADYVQAMNDKGIVTVGCCCGHFKAQSTVIVAPESADRMQALGYDFEIDENGNLKHVIALASVP